MFKILLKGYDSLNELLMGIKCYTCMLLCTIDNNYYTNIGTYLF